MHALPILLLLLAQTTGPVAGDARLAKTADIATTALELADLIATLSEKTGVTLTVAQPQTIWPGCLVVAASKGSYAELLERLAGHLDARWVRTGEEGRRGYRLELTAEGKARRSEAARRLRDRILKTPRGAVAEMAAILKKESQTETEAKAKAWREMGRSMWQSGESGAVVRQWSRDPGRLRSLLASPEVRSAVRLLSAWGDAEWHKLIGAGSLPTVPAQSQQEAARWVTETWTRQQDPAQRDRIAFSGEATGRVVARLGVKDYGALMRADNVAGLSLLFRLTAGGELTMEATALDKAGTALVAGETVLCEPAPLGVGAAREYDKYEPLTKPLSFGMKIVPCGEPPCEFARGAIVAAGGRPPLPEDAVFSGAIKEIAKQSGLNLIAEAPARAARIPLPHALVTGAALNELNEQAGLDWTLTGGWLTVRVVDAPLTLNERLPHSLVKDVLRIGREGRGLSVDQLASFARSLSAEQWLELGETAALYGLGDGILPPTTEETRSFLDLYAGLSEGQKKLLATGRVTEVEGLASEAAAAAIRLGANPTAPKAMLSIVMTDVVVQRNQLDNGFVYEHREVDGLALNALAQDPRFLESVYSRDPARAHKYMLGQRVTFKAIVGGATHTTTILRPSPDTAFLLSSPPASVRAMMEKAKKR